MIAQDSWLYLSLRAGLSFVSHCLTACLQYSLKLCVLLLYCNKIDLGLKKKQTPGNMARWTRGIVENISGRRIKKAEEIGMMSVWLKLMIELTEAETECRRNEKGVGIKDVEKQRNISYQIGVVGQSGPWKFRKRIINGKNCVGR